MDRGHAVVGNWSNVDRKEIIVVDDGSTDRTLEVIRQFESKGVSVVTQENQGAAAARNKAFSVSRGDYIQWLDADDLWRPTRLPGRWNWWTRVIVSERCSLPLGDNFCTDTIGRSSIRLHFGAILLPQNGSCVRWTKTSICKLLLGWSVVN